MGKAAGSTPATCTSVVEDDKALDYGAGFRTYLCDNAFMNVEIECVDHEYSYRSTALDFNFDADAPVARASVTVGMTF